MVRVLKTLYINLEKRIDKRNRTENELIQNQNYNFERFPAINGPDDFSNINDLVKHYQKFSFNPIIFQKDKIKNSRRYRAKISCWLSHFSILKRFMISDLTYEDWILILEDDIKIMYSFDEFLYWIKKTLYRYHNADIIICGDRVGICGPVKTIDQINKFKKNKNYGLECYLVRCRSIDKFINELYLDREQNYCSIDNKIAELHSRKRINVVPLEAPSYGICIDKDQKDSDIEIENTIEDFWH